jgi:hypothetical protein
MCLVGRGDGIGARRSGTTAPCVERAGVEVLERETVVLRRVFFGAFALARLFGAFALARLELRFEFRAGFATLATGLRDDRRALPLTLRRDAAFNCFPLLWFRTPVCRATAPGQPRFDGDISVAGRSGRPLALFPYIGPERRIPG